VDVATVIRAQAGDLAALEVISRTAGKAEEERLAKMASDDSAAAALSIELDGILKVAAEYHTLGEQMEDNAGLARLAGDVKTEVEKENRDQISRTRKADEDRWNALGAKYDEAFARESIKVNVEPVFPTDLQVSSRVAALSGRHRLRVPVDLVTRSGRVLPE
jgi:hypothetical protein